MIGGISRNAGKTTLACHVIRQLKDNFQVIGLKVTSIRPGEEDQHGDHPGDKFEKFSIMEELDSLTQKDTSKMLSAGAKRVFFIRTVDAFQQEAISAFLLKYNPGHSPIVCESRSLRDNVLPGLFVMMMRDPVYGKPKAYRKFLDLADLRIDFQRDNPFPVTELPSIKFNTESFSFCLDS